MWAWMQDNSGALSVLLNGAMLVVWLAYLQVFFVSFRRSNRAVIHISEVQDTDGESRCMVTNMGSDVVYLLGVKVDLTCEGRQISALVTDRTHDDEPLGGSLRDRTNQGPLCGGEVLDIGSMRRICERALSDSKAGITDCSALEITVIVAAQQAKRLMGGYMCFDISGSADRPQFTARDVLTPQITTRNKRRMLERALSRPRDTGAATADRAEGQGRG